MEPATCNSMLHGMVSYLTPLGTFMQTTNRIESCYVSIQSVVFGAGRSIKDLLCTWAWYILTSNPNDRSLTEPKETHSEEILHTSLFRHRTQHSEAHSSMSDRSRPEGNSIRGIDNCV
ncbi:hypothetical protein AVEN_101210-1 [Araneus ventricosus]|uniref:Uncharacterized protein n=1 Tax=Araneus ventricosus TaxID=182803 RepID=A0A4Y2K765_ARAVE|nr:hypothetical protein AVEN_101210-1 [Araneus ventricosus]